MAINILIVDDSDTLRKIIRHYLEPMPHVVFFEASNGIEAETIIQEQDLFGDPIQLVMLDWMMPELTGAQLLERLRSTEKFKEEPKVIMLTAETYKDQLEHCMTLGISAYITKPFTQEQIIEAATKALEEKT